MHARRAALLIALPVLASCATTRLLRMDPAYVTVSKEELEIAGFNAAELWACGTAAAAAHNPHRAALCFSRLADDYPQDPNAHAAGYQAGIAYQEDGAWLKAVERLTPYMDAAHGHGEALDAAWRVATCMYQLGDYRGAIRALEPVIVREDLPAEDIIHAITHTGVCLIELGETDEAEKRLRQALEMYRVKASEERIEDYFPAQAQFFVGEIYRLQFEDVRLAEVDDKDKLGADLEYKAELLLSAQGHYLRAIRIGNPHWGTAAGERIGQLYEELYDQMMNAPVPHDLNEEEAHTYLALLRRKVRVLVQKAIAIYERTLSTAERIGVDSAFVVKTKESLDRMKQVLLADAHQDEVDGVTDVPIGIQPSPNSPPPSDDEDTDKKDAATGRNRAALAR